MGSLVLAAEADPAAAREAARRMLAAAPHRGDQTDLISFPGGAIGVSHRGTNRNESGIGRAGEHIAAFAGQIDNIVSLAREHGIDTGPSTHPDGGTTARLLAAGFASEGVDLLRKLRGVFTVALAAPGEVVVARDQLGFKALYHAERNGAAYFANEPHQVLAGASIPADPNMAFLHGSLFGQPEETDETAMTGVLRFPRASWARVSNGAPRPVRYWDPSPLLEGSDMDADEATEELAHRLQAGIRRAVRGNEAVALSGGIDSPIVAAYAAHPHMDSSGKPLKAISAVFPHLPDVDESKYIEKVVERYGLEWHPFVQKAKAMDDIELWVRRLGNPGKNLSIPEVAEMYQLANSLGATTVFTGELAEFVYAYHLDLLAYLMSTLRLGAAGHHIRERRLRGQGWASIARELGRSMAPSPLLYWWLRSGTRRALPPWIDFERLAGRNSPFDYPWARRRWRQLEIAPAVSDFSQNLDDLDVVAEHCGVNVRMPIADVDTWEFMISLPAEVKYPNPKRKTLVRQAMRGVLPDEILDRQDKTFFNSHMLETADYGSLQRWILKTDFRLDGIDYDSLEDHLAAQAMGPGELDWVYDLARIHAFIAQWE
ncbi:MAG TPA: asparagine synthase-related protein [Acidimicrobiia bacterium]|nr:asparagine synthase-related protein [Acidimicrobiia bacterium]